MSYILILMIGVTVAVLAFIWAQYEVAKLKETPLVHQVETKMMTMDDMVHNVAGGDINSTMYFEVKYNKGVIEVDEDKDWIKYTATILGSPYPGEISETGLPTQCSSDTYAIEDNETLIKMSRISGTDVFRGGSGTGGQSQRVEIVVCFDNVDIVKDPECAGRGGPRATVTLRKIGYNHSTSKPKVEVSVC
ncbi:MAG: hypothetical protein J7L23_03570 [Candidatus Diapherotrites archaeon]|nr:hypothetical protein [Candidatus Diapherotrites archaeon]